MALLVVREELILVPVGVATEISPINVNRLGFTLQGESIGTHWWVRFLSAAAEDAGFHKQGREVYDLNQELPSGPSTTERYTGVISIFVKGTETNARFWVVEVE